MAAVSIVLTPASSAARIASIESFSSFPPHIHPPIAQAPKMTGVTRTSDLPRVLSSMVRNHRHDARPREGRVSIRFLMRGKGRDTLALLLIALSVLSLLMLVVSLRNTSEFSWQRANGTCYFVGWHGGRLHFARQRPYGDQLPG